MREIDHRPPGECDGTCEIVKVIYCGLPGRLCLRCNALRGLASYAPFIVNEAPDGQPAFEFYVYRGMYLPALWRWFRMGFRRDP